MKIGLLRKLLRPFEKIVAEVPLHTNFGVEIPRVSTPLV